MIYDNTNKLQLFIYIATVIGYEINEANLSLFYKTNLCKRPGLYYYSITGTLSTTTVIGTMVNEPIAVLEFGRFNDGIQDIIT